MLLWVAITVSITQAQYCALVCIISLPTCTCICYYITSCSCRVLSQHTLLKLEVSLTILAKGCPLLFAKPINQMECQKWWIPHFWSISISHINIHSILKVECWLFWQVLTMFCWLLLIDIKYLKRNGFSKRTPASIKLSLKGTLTQNWKSPYVFKFI